jgi:hypothetical protein
MNLNQEVEENMPHYLSKKKAYQNLKELTGQDFGYNVQKWKQWIKDNKVSVKYPKGKPNS